MEKYGRIGQAIYKNVRVTRRMRSTCWIPKTINTRSEYVILIAFPRQQYFRHRAPVLRYSTLPVSL